MILTIVLDVDGPSEVCGCEDAGYSSPMSDLIRESAPYVAALNPEDPRAVAGLKIQEREEGARCRR